MQPLSTVGITNAILSLRLRSLSIRWYLLERVLKHIILSHPVLPSLLRHDVLNNHLFSFVVQEAPDESRIPQLARYAEIFAAPHERIGFAAFCGGRYAVSVEVLLFAACYRYETTLCISLGYAQCCTRL